MSIIQNAWRWLKARAAAAHDLLGGEIVIEVPLWAAVGIVLMGLAGLWLAFAVARQIGLGPRETLALVLAILALLALCGWAVRL